MEGDARRQELLRLISKSQKPISGTEQIPYFCNKPWLCLATRRYPPCHKGYQSKTQ